MVSAIHLYIIFKKIRMYFIIISIFFIIRFIVPVSMIVINDVWAYVFGFFFGRTPLIKLSPKKTWEGFIGGGLATVFFGLLVRDWFYSCHLFTLEYFS